MVDALIAIILIGTMLGALALGVWVSVALFLTGFVGILLYSNAPVGSILATNIWTSSSEWSLAALPLFIWMGEILFRSRVSKDLFVGLAPWMRNLPGGLSHIGILSSAIFAAVSGSSAATCATVAKVALPELRKRGYDERLVIGAIAGSGTLGLMIPPSVILIVYGVAAELSIARLFMAGVLPGLLIVALYMLYIGVWSMLNPSKVPEKEPAMPLLEKIRISGSLIPISVLIGGVIGSIYLGWASPTDSAAVGVVLSLLLSWWFGDLTWASFKEGLISATLTSAMIAFIMAGAAFLTLAMGYSGMPTKIAGLIGGMALSNFALIAVLTVFFIVVGCFLDGISIVVLTTAVLLPTVIQAGIDPIWFGIFLVLVVEMGQLTPPVGLNLFVLQGMTGHNILWLSVAVLPFFLLLVVALILIFIFPDIVHFLPSLMFDK